LSHAEIILDTPQYRNYNLNISLDIISLHHTNSEINLIVRILSFNIFPYLTNRLSCPRYLWSEELCPLIYQDLPADDRSRRGTRHRQRRAPPEVAAGAAAAVAAAEEAAAASPPAPVPGCRRRALYRKPQCLPEAATSLEHLSTPATRRSRGDNPAGTHPPRLPGE